ncbi:MAG: hypothetical protein ACLT0W_10145 [Clostridium sp.]
METGKWYGNCQYRKIRAAWGSERIFPARNIFLSTAAKEDLKDLRQTDRI